MARVYRSLQKLADFTPMSISHSTTVFQRQRIATEANICQPRY
jgi:hypothetical protein